MDYTISPPAAPQSGYTVEPPAEAKPASSSYTVEPPKAQASGYTVDPPQKNNGGILSQVGGAVAGVGKAPIAGLKDLGSEIMKEGVQNAQDIKGDFTAPIQSHDKAGKPGAPGFMDYAARAGKTGMDILQRPFVAPQAAVTSLIGRPGEELTGIKKERFGDVAGYALPFAPEIRALAKSPQAMDTAKAFEKLMSPTTVSKEAGATEKTIRRATGEGSLQAEKSAASLVHDNRIVANMPVQAQRALVDDIENGRVPSDPKLAGTAQKIAKVFSDYRGRIAKILPATANQKFIDDYYVHMWKDKPATVSAKMGAYAKQGSGKNLKARSIPTIADGIKAGLTPVTENPIEATTMYAQNMSRFLATHDIQNELKLQGYAKWFSPGSGNIPNGWKPLDGIMTSKTAPLTKGGAVTGGRPIQLFAPPDVARVYNNFISKGFESGDGAPIAQAIRAGANGLTMLKLGLSPFHLSTMANEAITSGFARAYKALSKGDVGTAAKAAGGAIATPVTSAMRGMKMQRQLLDLQVPDSTSKAVNDAFVRSGGRLKMDPFYRARASGSFFNAIEKGTFKSELKAAAEKMYKGTPWENLKGVVDMGGNIIQSVAAPLFEKYIPAVKRGAFASSMEDWIKANPKASQDEIDKAAIKLSDSIDNRFGELVQDNLFWKKQMKQIAQILLVSPTWDLGTVREIGGGLKDAVGDVSNIAKGKGISDRTAYIAGLATQVALKNAIYTYMKTGTAPHGKDFMAGRTGGTVPGSDQPERVQTPGYEKDVYAFGYNFPHNVLAEGANKLNTFVQATTGLATNKDYRGLPIYRPQGAPEMPGEKGVGDFIEDTLMPISLGQFDKGKKGTNIGPMERLLTADRPAPAYVQDPKRAEDIRTHFNALDWKKKVKADARAKAQLK